MPLTQISELNLLSGMALGLASALHCAAMCGGIASGVGFFFEPEDTAGRARGPLRSRRVSGPFVSGLTWGIVPCPIVYGALFVAMLTGSAGGGLALMAGFGIGTLPAGTAPALGV